MQIEKALFVLLLLGIVIPNTIVAQYAEDAEYFVWITHQRNIPVTEGKLIDLYEDGLLLTEFGQYRPLEVPIETIRYFKYRRKGAGGKAVGVGSLIGGGVGIISGYLIASQPSEGGFDALGNVIGGIVVAGLSLGTGIVVGAIIGNRRKLVLVSNNRFELDAHEGLRLRYRF